MKIKTSELKGTALDWLVAKCEGISLMGNTGSYNFLIGIVNPDQAEWKPSTDWSQGGPIIEKEYIGFLPDCGKFWAIYSCGPMVGQRWYGNTPLIAAMRCYVASKLGDEVDVPEKVWGI